MQYAYNDEDLSVPDLNDSMPQSEELQFVNVGTKIQSENKRYQQRTDEEQYDDLKTPISTPDLQAAASGQVIPMMKVLDDDGECKLDVVGNDEEHLSSGNKQLTEAEKRRAQKAFDKEMARRLEEEKKEEQERMERVHWKDTHEKKLNEWEFDNTVRRNVMTLIGKLPDVLPQEITNNPKVNWKPIPIAKLLNESQLKRGYFKAIRVVHPDKSSQRGDSIEAQVCGMGKVRVFLCAL